MEGLVKGFAGWAVAAAVVGGLFGVGGCSPSGQRVDSEKRESLRLARVYTIDNESVTSFARTRTAVLLTGADEASDVSIGKRNVKGRFRLNGEPRTTIGGCVAVPIDARGYWLTASHCVDSGAAVICMPETQGGTRGVPARVVWKGDHTQAGRDMAVLHAPLQGGVKVVDVASNVRMHTLVVCVGSGIATDPISAGRVTGVGGATDGSVTWFEHTAPLMLGDSGGPAFYSDGMLAGINVMTASTFLGENVRSTAIHPNMREIKALIDRDAKGIRK